MSSMIDLEIAELEPQSAALATVAKWLNGAWDIPLGYSLAETTTWCRGLANATNEAILIAKHRNRLVGTVAVVACDLETRKDLTPWLSSLFVSPSDRGKMIGQALVEAACGWARRRHFTMLYLYARRGSLIGYYGRLGWSPMAGFELDGIGFELMQKTLGKPGQEL